MGLEEGVTLPVCDNLETKSRKRKRSSSPSAHTAGGAQRKSQSLPKLGDEGNGNKTTKNGRKKTGQAETKGSSRSTKLPVISNNNKASTKLPALTSGNASGSVNDGKFSSPELLILPQVALTDGHKNSNKNSRKIGWE